MTGLFHSANRGGVSIMNSQLDGARAAVNTGAPKSNSYQLRLPTAAPDIEPPLRTANAANKALQRAAAWRHERIKTAAYYLAERRGFEPGHEAEDWRHAEAQIDALDAEVS